MKHVVTSRSYGEQVFLRIVGGGRGGVRYGLVRDAATATTFPHKVAAGMAARRAGSFIMRAFEAIEFETRAAAPKRP
jgi:hypothetical protein